MTDDDIELIDSPLTRMYSAEGHTLHIQIYRCTDSPWVLEIEDELGTSTVWNAEFDTDTAALEAAIQAIEAQGIHHFVTTAQREAQAAERAHLRQQAQTSSSAASDLSGDMMMPLSSTEMAELDALLLELGTEEGMTLDMLDGFLHALAIGPETVMPSRWLPKVWGQADRVMLPSLEDEAQNRYLLNLVLRHYNSIVTGFNDSPPFVAPLWGDRQYGPDTFEDAEIWAYGFAQGVALSAASWQPLFSDPEWRQRYRPLALLGASDLSDDEEELIRTPEQREALTGEIVPSLTYIHAYWLPVRRAVAEREMALRQFGKVGRNEPCPCGSGKKFKKCCGAQAALH